MPVVQDSKVQLEVLRTQLEALKKAIEEGGDVKTISEQINAKVEELKQLITAE